MRNRSERARVLIAYPFLMHYRRSVFLKLDNSPNLDLTFAASPGDSLGVKALSSNEVRKFVSAPVKRWKSFQWQRKAIDLALFGKFDAVVFLGDWASISTWIAAAILRGRQIPVLFWTIGWHRPEAGIRRFVRLLFYRLADELLLYGEIGRNLGIAQGYPSGRMRVVFNSVEPSPGELSPSIAALANSLHEQEVVGAVARLSPTKQFTLLLRAVAELNQRTSRDLTVLLVGEGPARDALFRLARKLGVRLVMPGAAYSAHDLDLVYSLLAVTVVPSAVGLTAIQSLAHGVPVISDDDVYSQGPEWEAIRQGCTGGVYPKRDLLALTDELDRWLQRVESEPVQVASACKEEVDRRWTATGQATLIEEAIFDHL